MPTSRLEKFIYAICSMEVSDLPAPLSRIEILWNCLITGETPDFEPQSRNEQYLMAMLDRYDISNLPAPMSRGEKLLYKIAVGETDLSDVPGYLSRYEELLKYLIENGGIGFEYVLHTLNQSLSTLYNTAEKPVKSAILSGNTLVNYFPEIIPTEGFDLQTDSQSQKILNYNPTLPFEEGQTYTVYIWLKNVVSNNSSRLTIRIANVDYTIIPFNEGLNIMEITISGINGSNYNIRIPNDYLAKGNKATVKDVVIIKNNTELDIVPFYGMQSVKMPVLKTTGKNLFDGQLESGRYTQSEGIPFADNRAVRTVNKIKVKPSTVYTLKIEDGTSLYNTSEYCNGVYIGRKTGTNPITFTTSPTTNELHLSFKTSNIQLQFQLEEGSQATSYEPYKTNILTVNEEVELRGIGDVRDDLDLLTGEVTQKLNEIEINDGSYFSNGFTEYENTIRWQTNITIRNKLKLKTGGKIYSTNFITDISNGDFEHIRLDGSNPYANVIIYLSKTKASTYEELKTYIKNNPFTIVAEKAEKSIKTVDLTTVDQNGQPTKLKTFNNITHVEIKADNLIPSVDLEVATKISETLSTMGLQHHDISETQNKLGQTIDEQTENTDATMMATTEIYEQTL